uniref:ORF41d n=1 Tax=Pinus koraiensis TaxID=88728 RepID=A4QM09_PINKO|nr:ORF41d [Pinus koraiensis]
MSITCTCGINQILIEFNLSIERGSYMFCNITSKYPPGMKSP